MVNTYNEFPKKRRGQYVLIHDIILKSPFGIQSFLLFFRASRKEWTSTWQNSNTRTQSLKICGSPLGKPAGNRSLMWWQPGPNRWGTPWWRQGAYIVDFQFHKSLSERCNELWINFFFTYSDVDNSIFRSVRNKMAVTEFWPWPKRSFVLMEYRRKVTLEWLYVVCVGHCDKSRMFFPTNRAVHYVWDKITTERMIAS